LIELGRQAGLTDARFAQCVTDQTYQRWVQDATVAASQRGVHGTPTVLVNGAQLALVPGDPNAVTMLRDAIAKPAG
jgi:2-hydroxychromene-2-carboxylate isomerase